MNNEKTSVFSNGMIWFGAAVSIAEILTGTLLTPLGFARGIAAVVLGHGIGCSLMYFAGLIGAGTGKSAMDTVKISFGSKGAILFSVMNVLQLVGWTAVMIIGGARATGVILNPAVATVGDAFWCILIGALIILWIGVGIKTLDKLNVVAMTALFVLTLVLSAIIFRAGSAAAAVGSAGGMSFGAAVELSVAMPLSWLPLISDYTRAAKKPQTATAVSVLAYFLTSCWMYIIGLGAAIFTGQSDIARIFLQAGLGIGGVIVVILSTVTTTFLDAYSAGVSFTSITAKVGEKPVAIGVCLIGTLLALFTPIEQYEGFLYLIGSVFAPMVAILITDFFILRRDYSAQAVNGTNLLLWLAGFLLYRRFMSLDTVVGSTLPVMIIVSLLSLLINGRGKARRKGPGRKVAA